MRKRLSLKLFLLTFLIFFLTLLLPLLINHSAPSVSEKQKVPYSQTEFIKEVAPTIQKISKSYGVCSSTIIAQAILESDYGSNVLSARYKNLFGVLAQSGDASIILNGTVYKGGSWQSSNGSYVIYRTWQDSIYHYFALLKSGKIGIGQTYKRLVSNKGYRQSAQILQNAGLSTDPDYANKLIKVVEDNDLTVYDK